MRFAQRMEADPFIGAGVRSKPGETRTEVGGYALAFIEKYGVTWTPRRLPADIPRGPESHCYENARRLVMQPDHRSWAYVEGIGHAWCVDGAGSVIDNTHPADLPLEEYFGVAFPGYVVGLIKMHVGTLESVVGAIDWAFPALMDDLPELLDRRFHPSV
jgi:hypothetical protein